MDETPTPSSVDSPLCCDLSTHYDESCPRCPHPPHQGFVCHVLGCGCYLAIEHWVKPSSASLGWIVDQYKALGVHQMERVDRWEAIEQHLSVPRLSFPSSNRSDQPTRYLFTRRSERRCAGCLRASREVLGRWISSVGGRLERLWTR